MKLHSKPVGIMGGTFDPVHFGHLAIARLAQEYFNLETIYFVPAFVRPHKAASFATPFERLAMLNCAIKKSPGFNVWDGELKRGGKSYTLDTLKFFSLVNPDRPLYFIIGSDNIKEIPLWHRYKELLTLATFCVAHRPGHSLEAPKELDAARIMPFLSPEWKISSTMIREYLTKGYSCEYLVPPPVLAYIKEHGLYRKPLPERSRRATADNLP